MTYTQYITEKQKPKHQIVKAAADALLIHADDLLDVNDDRKRSTEHRYMVFGLMELAGYTHQEIADFFKLNRESVTKALTKLEVWVELYADLRGKYSLIKKRVLYI